ncbi:MAG: DoxX family protein [Hymenobacter sp.]|nr:DoxX family protein [Hymenobacter sp.]
MEHVIVAPKKASTLQTVGYWVATGLVLFELLYGASWDFNWVNKGYVQTVMTHLNYPSFLPAMLGAAKLSAALVLLAPRLPVLKEWAYAGLTFLFGGAVASHLAAGDGMNVTVWPLAFGTLVLASWWLRPANRRVAAVTAAEWRPDAG